MNTHDRQILCSLLKHPGNGTTLSHDAGHSYRFWRRLKYLAKRGLVRTAGYGSTTWASVTEKGMAALAPRRKPTGIIIKPAAAHDDQSTKRTV